MAPSEDGGHARHARHARLFGGKDRWRTPSSGPRIFGVDEFDLHNTTTLPLRTFFPTPYITYENLTSFFEGFILMYVYETYISCFEGSTNK